MRRRQCRRATENRSHCRGNARVARTAAHLEAFKTLHGISPDFIKENTNPPAPPTV
jgi:hypothetical protein